MKRLLIIPFIFLSLILSATNYYVKNTGNDAANGLTDGTAWQTVNKVSISAFNPGDTIFFKCGDTWHEAFRGDKSNYFLNPSSGTLGHDIVFTSYGTGAKPIFDNSFVASSWTEGTDDVSPELVTNGTFATDASWSKGTGVTISGNAAHATGQVVGWVLSQPLTWTLGKAYTVSYTITNHLRGSVTLTFFGWENRGAIRTTNGVYSEIIKPPNAGDGQIYFIDVNNTFVGDISNVSISEFHTVEGVYSFYTGTSAVWFVTEDGTPLTLATSALCTDGDYYFTGGFLCYKPTTGVASDHVVMYSPDHACFDVSNTSFISLINLHFKNCDLGVLGIGGESPVLDGTISNITIKECSFEQMKEQGILFYIYTDGQCNDNVIEDNYFYRCKSGLSAFVKHNTGDWFYDGWIISNNEFEECGTYDGINHTGTYDYEAIGLQNARNFTITDNYVHGGLIRGIFFYGEAAGLISNNIITRNIVKDNNAPGFIVNGDWGGGWGWKDNLVVYNQFINCGSSANGTFDSYAIRFEQDVRGVGGINKFVNNTIVSTSRDAMYLYINDDVASQYLEIKNNIITGYSRSAYYMDGLITDLVIDYNLYDIDGKFYYETDWRTLSYIRSNTAYGDNDIIGDPLFTSDFRLQSGSPAINTGIDVGLTSDYKNHRVPYNNGTPDIGAYEYGYFALWRNVNNKLIRIGTKITKQ
jgi:parallel beta-helix repeat protein